MSKFAKALMKPNDRMTFLERLQIYNQQDWFWIPGLAGMKVLNP